MLENPFYHEEDSKHDRCLLRSFLARLFVILLAIFLMAYLASSAYGAAIARASAEDGTVITLTDEPCQLDAIKNLKHRATWYEKGVTIEGCWGRHPAGLILFYFEDKTVVFLMQQHFQQVQGI